MRSSKVPLDLLGEGITVNAHAQFHVDGHRVAAQVGTGQEQALVVGNSTLACIKPWFPASSRRRFSTGQW